MENLHIIHGLKRIFHLPIDKKHTERILEAGDNVYLKHQSYKRTSVALRKNLKLAARYYGSYLVEDKIVSIAYELNFQRSTLSFTPVYWKGKIGEKE
ncbi:protein NYNRIN-like [Gossypium australe]|uniref:Protein NYNRIN-like n=1 Tax=Gossypium australe TaxID=47621 RepID=A0A5B6U510_9ROSI|nr:protein NYNRIN-like [Gossypium australe]